jgi:ABC-type phosphate transport system substrate-binding protein
MFLKKQTHWPDGSTIEPVEPPEKSRTRSYFLSDVMNGRSALALKTFWQKRVFSGRDTPPLEKASEEDVVAYVRATPGAVGYVAPATPVSGVKVLEIKD